MVSWSNHREYSLRYDIKLKVGKGKGEASSNDTTISVPITLFANSCCNSWFVLSTDNLISPISPSTLSMRVSSVRLLATVRSSEVRDDCLGGSAFSISSTVGQVLVKSAPFLVLMIDIDPSSTRGTLS